MEEFKYNSWSHKDEMENGKFSVNLDFELLQETYRKIIQHLDVSKPTKIIDQRSSALLCKYVEQKYALYNKMKVTMMFPIINKCWSKNNSTTMRLKNIINIRNLYPFRTSEFDRAFDRIKTLYENNEELIQQMEQLYEYHQKHFDPLNNLFIDYEAQQTLRGYSMKIQNAHNLCQYLKDLYDAFEKIKPFFHRISTNKKFMGSKHKYNELRNMTQHCKYTHIKPNTQFCTQNINKEYYSDTQNYFEYCSKMIELS